MPQDDKSLSVSVDDFMTLKGICTELINENADLKNDLEAKERELELMYSLNRRVTFTLDWEEVQEVVVELIHDFFPVVRLSVIAVYGDENQIHVTVKDGDAPVKFDILNMDFPVDHTSHWDDIVATDEWSNYIRSIENVMDMRSSFIPLSFNERQHGFLMVCKSQGIEYDEDEWRFLSTTANYVGMTLDNARLDRLSKIDVLTGLYSRRQFIHRLDRELERASKSGSSISLCMLDIDHFKIVNDEFGHPAGDSVLVELSRRLTDAALETEQVFRIGGEEMMVLSTTDNIEDAIQRAETMRLAVATMPFSFVSLGENVSRTITISGGVALYPLHAGDASSLISAADQALYKAKHNGRNRIETADA